MFVGIVPNAFCLMFVTTQARLGNTERNPFNFQTFKLQKLEVRTDTETLYLLQVDFPKDCTAAYFNLFANKYTAGRPLNIDIKEYLGGYCLLFCELQSNMEISDSGVWHKQKIGKCSINLTFGQALTESVDVVMLSTSLDTIQVTKDRHCLLASHLYRKHR